MAHILQTFSTLRLYKDALRLADRISKKTGADPRFLKNTIRHEFRKNIHETDPAKIAALREV
jgi:hypothetical protein